MATVNMLDQMQLGGKYTFWFKEQLFGGISAGIAFTGNDVQAALGGDPEFDSVNANIKFVGPGDVGATFIWKGDTITVQDAGKLAEDKINSSTSWATAHANFVEADLGDTQDQASGLKDVASNVKWVFIAAAVIAVALVVLRGEEIL